MAAPLAEPPLDAAGPAVAGPLVAGSAAAGAATAGPSLDRAPDRRFLILASLGAMAATGLACLALHLLSQAGTYGSLTDALYITPFWDDASRIQAGFIPYHDFALEYPPLSLPVFVLPAILPGGGLDYPSYRTMFELLIALCAMGIVPVVAWTIARLDGRRADVLLGLGFVAIAPLLLGPLAISRYDLWPALLTAAATLAMVSGRPRVGFAFLALGSLAKVYPAFLAPIFAWYAWRTAGGRQAAIAIVVGLVVVAAGLAPFVATDPGGTLAPFTRTIVRPLQVESLGASILVGLHAWLGLDIGPVTFGFDSYNLAGPLPEVVSSLQSGVLLGSLVVVTLVAAMGPARPDRFLLACAAALAVTVAFGKVLSPQYGLWLVPAIAALVAVSSRPVVGLAVVLVLTQIYFPARYEPYLLGNGAAAIAVIERNLALVIVAVYLAAITWARTRSPDPRPDPPADRALGAA